MAVIHPTVGRVLWYYSPHHVPGDQPFAATIAYVHSDRMINIGFLDANGTPLSTTSVMLLQEGDLKPGKHQAYCMWMPYQLGQAARTEIAEAKRPI